VGAEPVLGELIGFGLTRAGPVAASSRGWGSAGLEDVVLWFW